MKIVAVIPARYESSRFPGKPLVKILGNPMIQWVYEAVKRVDSISEVIVATDDDRIVDCVRHFGGKVVLTGECSCGTDRVYQAIKDTECDLVVNIQGDEPLITTDAIMQAIDAFEEPGVVVSTLKTKIDSVDGVHDVNAVKVVTDMQDNALYFSRSLMPFNREHVVVDYYRAIGVYCFSKSFLSKYVQLPRGPLECAESIEQLRVLEHGYKMKVVETEYNGFGVDIPEHIPIVESIINSSKKVN